MRAVRFDRYGGPEVLELREVDDPVAGAGEVVVRVRAAAINPGEIAIREGALAARWPTTFPSGEGSDLAGTIEQVGDGVSAFATGDEVAGWTDDRASHAELVAVPVDHLAAKPAGVPWEIAGSMFVAPMAAYASVDAVAPMPGELVVVSGAAGGVGSIAVQLARRTGANVIGLAGPANHDWLRGHGIVPIAYGDGQEQRIRDAAPGGVDAWIDVFGGGYVDLAAALGVAPSRINTIIDGDGATRVGASMEGSSQVATAAILADLLALVAAGELEVPIAATFPLDRVRDAYAELSDRHTHGKIVLLP
jgi:NADPH:quinone reductase-like Zn-dependent oxidoreductase